MTGPIERGTPRGGLTSMRPLAPSPPVLLLPALRSWGEAVVAAPPPPLLLLLLLACALQALRVCAAPTPDRFVAAPHTGRAARVRSSAGWQGKVCMMGGRMRLAVN